MDIEDKLDYLICQGLRGHDLDVFTSRNKETAPNPICRTYGFNELSLEELREQFSNIDNFYTEINGMRIKLYY